MNAHTGKATAVGAHSHDALTLSNWDEGVLVNACSPLDHFVVETRNSVYYIVVESPEDGEVLVRGGRLFPDFEHGQLVGATAGGLTVKPYGIYVGMCMELFVGRRSVVTSPVTAVYRTAAACASETSAARS